MEVKPENTKTEMSDSKDLLIGFVLINLVALRDMTKYNQTSSSN